MVNLETGISYTVSKSFVGHVRLVSGGRRNQLLLSLGQSPLDYTVDTETVSHHTTRLMWMRCLVGQTMQGNTCTGVPTSFTWVQLNEVGSDRVGYTDWRVPTWKELMTLVDYTQPGVKLFKEGFPGVYQGDAVWSSTAWETSPSSYFLAVDFGLGTLSANNKMFSNSVRLVRNLGPVQSPTECFFNWAESVARSYLSPAGQLTQMVEGTNLRYRAYANTGTVVGTDGQSLFALGGGAGPNLMQLGKFREWSPVAQAAGCR